MTNFGSLKEKHNPPNIRLARYWHLESNGEIVRCELCPWMCRIKEGRYGYCGVRFNYNGKLYTSIYGVVSSKAVDPIEKKPLFHFFPGSYVFSLGSIGCNLRCKHCQNWEIAHARAENYFFYLDFIPPEEAVAQALESGSSGIALTYNEPSIWIEYAIDVFKLAKERGLYTVFVTNGLINEQPLRDLSDVLDAFRVDVKGITKESYFRISGFKKVESVIKSAELAFNNFDLHVEIVTNIIPTVNDSEDELRNIARWIVKNLDKKVPWHVTRFYPYFGFSYLYPTPISTLEMAYKIGIEEGLEFVYIGNVPGHQSENTICPNCEKTVIKREGYLIRYNDTADGKCSNCGYDLNIVE